MSNDKFTLFSGGLFSQWHKADFYVWSIPFTHAEQWMMFAKAVYFKDYESAELILKAKNPGKQKALGRNVKGFDDSAWCHVAKQVVYIGNYAKFTQNPLRLESLLATYPTTLVEASLTDKRWGIGLAITDPNALDQSKWKGTNWLGEMITEVRNNIINGEPVYKMGLMLQVWQSVHSYKEWKEQNDRTTV